MKYRLRKISLNFLGFLALGFLLLGISYFHFFNNNILINEGHLTIFKEKKPVKSKKISDYVASLNTGKVWETDLNQEYTSVIIKNNNLYESHLFTYETGEEVNFTELIKPAEITNFATKIKELIALKYPDFIASVLSNMDHDNVYAFYENELIIYFYNYVINPSINEELSLKVNYNEIKDYLTIPVNINPDYQNEMGSVINTNKKLVSLTFDDGPSNLTKELVDTLNKNHVHATFFMVGNRLQSFQDVVRYVNESGNEIGYHSWAHQNLKREDLTKAIAEFNQSNELLTNIIGKTFVFMRPPYGAINNEIKEALDTAFILWNLDTEDWRYRDTEHIVNYVLDNVKEGSIILFHDMYRTTIDAIKQILPELYVRGYQAVTVSDLANSYNQPILKHNSYRYFTK